MSCVTLLGVPIDAIRMDEAIARMQAMLEGGQHHVVTPNNEMLVEASHHAPFRTVLSQAALRLPDSTGLLLAARFTGQSIPMRVSGVDVVERLCALLDRSTPVFFLGGKHGAGKRSAEGLATRNPQLVVAGALESSPRDQDVDAIIEAVNASGANILFVAYGAPMQDLWIAKHLARMPSVRIAMGVGGTFDFLSGRIRRAPRWMRQIGCEWLWRLCLQPWRIRRILNAVVVFPWLIVRYGKTAPMNR